MRPEVRRILLLALLEDSCNAVVTRRRSVWVHPVLRTRKEFGEYHRLVLELRLYGVEFQRYFRLDRAQFDLLLRKIGTQVAGQLGCREPISPPERLAICLRFLATGDSYRSIAFSYRVGVSTVHKVVAIVTRAIWDGLVDDYMPVPKEEDWRAIAREFKERWNFPNCIGAIDGKHVVIQAPACSGSQFYNYKGTFSIVLLAVVDANYIFRMVDVGNYGRASDGGTLSESAFGKALQDGTLSIPSPATLPGADHLGPVPHVFVGDEAFPLKPNLMRPHAAPVLSGSPRRLFNYRLSRARLVVECTFGILSAQWRLYRRVIALKPANVDACVKATCILHNFIRMSSQGQGSEGSPSSTPMVERHPGLQEITCAGGNQASRQAKQVRETLTQYFTSAAGTVPWQDNIV